jgi:hypothetical protein
VSEEATTLEPKVTASLRSGVESNRRRMVGPQEDERDSAGCGGEPATKWRSLKLTAHAGGAVKAMSGRMTRVAVERPDSGAQEVGRPGRRGDVPQESEPSGYRSELSADAKEPIQWHRRETRRPTENTNRLLRRQVGQGRTSAGSKPAPRDGG